MWGGGRADSLVTIYYAWVIFSRVTSYLNFSQNQFGSHLLSEVLSVSNFSLWGRWSVKEGDMTGSREEGKGFHA